MHNCIFTAHCTENVCDMSCPRLVETSYLLERNNISMTSHVFKQGPKDIATATNILNAAKGTMKVTVSRDTVRGAELLTYCAICQHWQGSRLHCNVYNLRYSKYIEEIKKSWTTKIESEELEYMKIWSNSAKVLIISNIDFVNFNDFESQTLLNLLQARSSDEYTTVVVSPDTNMLVGKGSFFVHLQRIFARAVIKC